MSCCGTCGTPLLPPSKPGPPRKWCSERCRKAQYAKACSDCGARINGTTPGKHGGRCAPCGNKARDFATIYAEARAKAHKRNECIVVMWGNGDKMGEIARAFQMTSTHLGMRMAQMRREGYDLPYRRTDEQRERMRLARGAVAA